MMETSVLMQLHLLVPLLTVCKSTQVIPKCHHFTSIGKHNVRRHRHTALSYFLQGKTSLEALTTYGLVMLIAAPMKIHFLL